MHNGCSIIIVHIFLHKKWGEAEYKFDFNIVTLLTLFFFWQEWTLIHNCTSLRQSSQTAQRRKKKNTCDNACSPEQKFKIDCYIKCENCNRKLAGPSLFWHMQKPPYAQGSVSQFQGHSCSRAWGELAPYCAPHNPPVHLHPPTFPPSTTHSSTHSPPNQGAFFSFGPNHGFSQNNVVYFSNGAGRSQARQGCPFATEKYISDGTIARQSKC